MSFTKRTSRGPTKAFVVIAIFSCVFVPRIDALSQVRARQQTSTAGRNLITISFSKIWDYQLERPARLIDVGPVTDTKRNNLIVLQPSDNANEGGRALLVLHWDGLRFSSDGRLDVRGQSIDFLMAGKFRSSHVSPQDHSPFDRPSTVGRPPVNGTAAPRPVTPNVFNGQTLPPIQVVSTDGVYVWQKGALAKLYPTPLDPRMGLVLGEQELDDRVICGTGDSATSYEIGLNRAQPSAEGAPTTGGGYARHGAGLQIFPGAEKMTLAPGIRYVQSIWDGKYKWMIGVARGSAAPTDQNPAASTGDRLVVYVPKFASRGKSFWQLTMDDFEEDWRSDSLPGHLLDVRIGEPKNDGKVGILVLTSENKDTEGHLYFYQQDR